MRGGRQVGSQDGDEDGGLIMAVVPPFETCEPDPPDSFPNP
jgi:hypothetical protein